MDRENEIYIEVPEQKGWDLTENPILDYPIVFGEAEPFDLRRERAERLAWLATLPVKYFDVSPDRGQRPMPDIGRVSLENEEPPEVAAAEAAEAARRMAVEGGDPQHEEQNGESGEEEEWEVVTRASESEDGLREDDFVILGQDMFFSSKGGALSKLFLSIYTVRPCCLQVMMVEEQKGSAFPGHHGKEDLSWNLKRFESGLQIKFHSNESLEACFSLIGVDAAIANAFRRILLAEVPTLAIDKCFIMDNGSVIADEVLAHRLGLIPLKGSLDGLKWLKWFIKADPEVGIEGMERSDYNTVSLRLNVACERNPNPPANSIRPEDRYINSNVYASMLEYIPTGQQIQRFNDEPIKAANPNILIAKLRPGQKIDITMHAHLGVGGDHAKFSPVATATYRLLPKIDIIKPILGADAKKFQKCFPAGVIDLERVTPADAAGNNPEYHNREGDEKAVVKDPMKDTVSRECLRHDEFKGKVKLGRIQDHFIFNIESTGQFPSDVLFLDAVNVLKFKAKRLLRALDDIEQ